MGSIRRAIIVIAETNLLSNAKTRLFSSQPESGGAGSAPISLIETVSEMQKTQTAEVVLALPKGGRAFLEEESFSGISRVSYGGKDVGEKLDDLLATAWKLRYQPCILVTCNEKLHPESLAETFNALRAGGAGYDIVALEDSSGGLCLLGLKWPQPALFKGLNCDAESLAVEILSRASDLHLTTHSLA